MDNEMIERVTEAISGCKLDSWHPNVQAKLKESAIAAIKAMREPTEKMIGAGALAPFDLSGEGSWQAMIDAIVGTNET